MKDPMDDYRTPCCKMLPLLKSRATWVCEGCKKDVSLDVILFYDATSTDKTELTTKTT